MHSPDSGIPYTEYPAVRRVMGPQRVHLDDAELEDLLVDRFPGADPLDVEDFMRDVQRFGKNTAPLANRALPGALQGAAQGAMVAGPYGALAGGAVGAAGGLAARRSPAPHRRAGAPRPATPPAGRSGGATRGNAARIPPPLPRRETPTPAAQLLALLSQPETLQALLALALADAGRQRLRVGDGTVPSAAFARAISRLAGEAAESVSVESDPVTGLEGYSAALEGVDRYGD
ncbi:MAG: hypothetical protein ACM30G_22570 [Micromonosporaceae bacterium]